MEYFPSNTAFAFFLGAVLLVSGISLLRKPWIFGDNVNYTLFNVTHTDIFSSDF